MEILWGPKNCKKSPGPQIGTHVGAVGSYICCIQIKFITTILNDLEGNDNCGQVSLCCLLLRECCGGKSKKKIYFFSQFGQSAAARQGGRRPSSVYLNCSSASDLQSMSIVHFSCWNNLIIQMKARRGVSWEFIGVKGCFQEGNKNLELP